MAAQNQQPAAEESTAAAGRSIWQQQYQRPWQFVCGVVTSMADRQQAGLLSPQARAALLLFVTDGHTLGASALEAWEGNSTIG
jgi:hypothetical protein